jgi:hypothetical protein
MKRFKVIAATLGLLLFAGCASPCVKLAQKICECQPTQNDRDTCNSNVSARADQVEISETDQQTCDALIDTCACHEINTPEGKRACGLAR